MTFQHLLHSPAPSRFGKDAIVTPPPPPPPRDRAKGLCVQSQCHLGCRRAVSRPRLPSPCSLLGLSASSRRGSGARTRRARSCTARISPHVTPPTPRELVASDVRSEQAGLVKTRTGEVVWRPSTISETEPPASYTHRHHVSAATTPGPQSRSQPD